MEIYALTEPDSGNVRYIGKAKSAVARLRSHLRDSRRRNTPVYTWIRKLIENGCKPGLVVLVRCHSGNWKEVERAAIAKARGENANLLNVADGGDEPYCSLETRAKNGRLVAQVRSSSDKKRRLWYLKLQLGQALKQGFVGEATKAKMRARPDIFGGMAGL